MGGRIEEVESCPMGLCPGMDCLSVHGVAGWLARWSWYHYFEYEFTRLHTAVALSANFTIGSNQHEMKTYPKDI
jgi:hypothetical protein